MLQKLSFCVILILSSLWAKVDYSSMSTEELIALIGYVKSENEIELALELAKRASQMNEEEKRLYLELNGTQENAEK